MDIKSWRKFRIGILMGGPSYEHDVSLRSGGAVYAALKEIGLDVIPVKLPKDLCIETDSLFVLFNRLIKETGIDLIFNSLHGRFGEDGQLQRVLDKIGLPYTGSKAKASYLAMDKIASRNIFRNSGIPVPECLVLNKLNRRNFTLAFPVVVKPVNGGSSIGVSIIERREELNKAIRLALLYDNRVIAEEYIPGKEITVGIIEDSPLPVIQVVPRQRFYNYNAKYQDHGTDYLVPAPIPDNLQKKARAQAVKAHKALGCASFSRVDMILKDNGDMVVLEVNTIPGLTDRSLLPKAAKFKNISFSKVCLKILDSAFLKGCVKRKRKDK